jgi:hypothetical protein
MIGIKGNIIPDMKSTVKDFDRKDFRVYLKTKFSLMIGIVKYLAFLLFFVTSCFGSTTTLRERVEKGEKGDFIVTLENGIYTLLAIQDITLKENSSPKLSLVEISIPQNLVDLKKFSWRQWSEMGASNSTSYIIYEIDLKKDSLLSCYSVTKNCYLTSSNQDSFFNKLLALPLENLPDLKRKKIGSPPLDDSFDHRAIWNPPQVIDGVKQKRPTFIVYQTTWPKDGSDLSGKMIDLYFDNKSFIPFPYWIQVSNGNIEVMLKIIDSGKKIDFPKNRPTNF